MLILAMDSTAIVGSVALCDDERLLAEFTVNIGHTHSETLLPMVESVLRTCGKSVSVIDLFACTAGPGSFTGVRIGAATLKGIAFGRGKPCVGVSTLESLATNAIAFDGVICPAMNARRSQVYNALFSCEHGVQTRLCDDRALAISELGEELKSIDKPIYLVGDGAELVYEALKDMLGERLILLPQRLLNQSGYSTALCALSLYRQGSFGTHAELAPVYLRPSQAERMRMEKEKTANAVTES